jgi:prepilin-type N-terminal cleavage/methylation domain-containing protein
MFAKPAVLSRPRRRDAGGFTLPEVLVAALVITIAFVALLSVIPYSSAAVQSGNQLSTATFLANQKLEEAKNVPWTSAPDNDCLGISATSTSAPTVPAGKTCTLGGVVVNAGGALAWAANEGSSAITNFNGYSRNVRVTNCGVGTGCTGIVDAGMRLVTVAVTFQPMTTSSTAAATKTVTVSMVVSQR